MNRSPVFLDYARYYDLLYKDKDYGSEADYIHQLVQRWRPNANSVLELGSGTGKHAFLLAGRGYIVHGVDRSEEMVAQSQHSRQHRSPTTTENAVLFSQGDVRSVRLDDRFDIAVSLFHVVSYQVSNDDVLAALKTARAHLGKDGIFIFDAWYGPAVLTDRPAVRVKRMADEQIEVTRIAEPVMRPNANVVDVNYHVFVRQRATGSVTELRETHEMRYLFTPEIDAFAGHAGFELVAAEEWMTGRPLGFDTWAACFVLRCV